MRWPFCLAIPSFFDLLKRARTSAVSCPGLIVPEGLAQFGVVFRTWRPGHNAAFFFHSAEHGVGVCFLQRLGPYRRPGAAV